MLDWKIEEATQMCRKYMLQNITNAQIFYTRNYLQTIMKHIKFSKDNLWESCTWYKRACQIKYFCAKKDNKNKEKKCFFSLHFKNCFPQKLDNLGLKKNFFCLQNLKFFFYVIVLPINFLGE